MTAIKQFLARLWAVLSTVKALVVAGLVMGLTYVTTIDSSLVPWDSILGLFIKDETKLPSAAATAVGLFTVLRWVAPAVIEGLRYLINRPSASGGAGGIDVPDEDLHNDEEA